MKKNLHSIILAFVFGTATINAQNAQLTSLSAPISNNPNGLKDPCATVAPDLKWENKFQELVAKYVQSQQMDSHGQTNEAQAATVVIPVIFHVVHGGQAVGTTINLAQAQINSEIAVLNADFGGVGFNSGLYPATAFQTYATNAGLQALSKDGTGRVKIANCYVQFCLATKDTNGNALVEPGIERINYTSKGWANPASFGTNASFKTFIDGTVKAQTIWNVNKYFNVWLTDISGSIGLLGYATFPALTGMQGLSGATGTNTDDGVWVYSPCIGSSSIYASGYYLTNYDKGRTLTHETGHWLGLRHIWGDNGQCGATDYCVDTPPQYGGSSTPAGCNFGIPSYPINVNLCTRPDGYNNANVTNSNGDMFMNFMDYVNDASHYMYTWDQQTRIQTSLANCPYRNKLGTHGLCVWTTTAAVAGFTINNGCKNAIITPTNLTTGSPLMTYSWSASPSAGVVFAPNTTTATPNITFANSGAYVITLTSNNGSASTFTANLTVNPLPTVTITNPSQTICANGTVTLTANGGATYTWSSGGGNAATANYVVVAFTTYTVFGSTALGCTNSAVAAISTKSLPVVGITVAPSNIICVGQVITFTASGGNTYTWSPGGSNNAVVSYTPGTSQQYTVTATDVDGCTDVALKTIFVNTCAGIQQSNFEEGYYNVYPNPTTGKINIQVPNSKTAQLINVEIYDLIGKSVLKQSLTYNISETINSINISTLPSGSYFLKLSSSDGITTKPIRIIKSN